MVTLASLARRYQRAVSTTDAAREALYAAIREAHAQGRSLRSIGAEVGLSWARVGQIVKG